MQCQHFVELTTNYLDGALTASERAVFENHAMTCAACGAYLAQMRQVIRALGRLRDEPLPPGAKESLIRRLKETNWGSTVSLGINGASISPGSHIGYFWEDDAEFRAGVGLLEAGLADGDFCVAFGHDEANERVLATLQNKGFDTQGLNEASQLCTLGGKSSGDEMLAAIGGRFQQAQSAGANRIRLLGNIGWDRPGWPGEENILEFEARVTDAAGQFPCVVVCMYDVRSLPGRVLLKGGFETHPHTIRGNVLRENPYYVPTQAFLAHLQGARESAPTSA